MWWCGAWVSVISFTLELPFFWFFSLPFSVFVLLLAHIIDVIQFILQKLEIPSSVFRSVVRVWVWVVWHTTVRQRENEGGEKGERTQTSVCVYVCDLGIDSSENWARIHLIWLFMESELRSQQTALNHDYIGLEFIVSANFFFLLSNHVPLIFFTFITSMHINSTSATVLPFRFNVYHVVGISFGGMGKECER